MSRARPWLLALLVVTLGWLVSPTPVPVYDGVGVPDEPYRYVTPPPGYQTTPAPVVATGVTTVKKGISVRGLVVATTEQSPQFSLYVPIGSLASKGTEITVRAEPVTPTGQPTGKVIAGNAYRVSFTDPAGPVTPTSLLASGSLYLRAIDTTDGWAMHYRATPADPWQPRPTQRSGTDSFTSSFGGAGEYALAKSPQEASEEGGIKPLPLVLGGALLLLVVVVVAVRLRAAPE